MPSTTNNPPFHIGKDYLEHGHADRAIRIEDRTVEGISTRVLRSENWMENRPDRRFVDVEYRADDGKIRNAVIESAVPSHGPDDLAD